MSLTILVDGDIYAYKAATSVERATNWGNIWTLHADENEAFALFDQLMSDLKEELSATNVVVALSDDKDNWRKAVMPSYKSNRKDTRKPMVLPSLRNYISENYTTYIRPGLEADDILGILQTHPTLVKGTKMIVSGDKDLYTIPGVVYRQKTATVVTPIQAAANHLLQTLTGDVADGYPGCPGVGAVNAQRILAAANITHTGGGAQEKAWWAAVVQAYLKAGLTEEDALQNARVARICHAQDYDLKAKKVILWNPPQLDQLLSSGPSSSTSSESPPADTKPSKAKSKPASKKKVASHK